MLLYEISRRFIYLSKQEEPSFSWQNSVLCIAVNKHLSFFDFSYNIQSTEKNLDLKENVVRLPNDSPVSTQVFQNHVQKGMKHFELTEMVTNPLFWPHSKYLKNEMEGMKSLKCSPDNFFNNSQCLVAVLNNFGNINFLSKNRCTYTVNLNFTQIILDTQAPFSLKEAKNIEKVKEFTYKTATGAMCWAPNLNEDRSCYFVTVQSSGDILFWSLTCENVIKSKFCGKFQVISVEDIEDITWIPFSDKQILLACSDRSGQVILYEFYVTEHFKFIKEHVIWQHQDKMAARCVHSFKFKDKLVILYIKNRHVVVQFLDKEFNVITQNILPVNDHKIVSLVNLNNEFYVGTMNTKLYQLNISIRFNDLNVSLNAIDIKENLQHYELAGMGLSQNKAFFGLVVKDRRLYHRKESIKIDLVFLSTSNDSIYYLDKLTNNPSQSLSNYWDCIEPVRCLFFKYKNIPEYDYNGLLVEGESNVYKLKVYYFILLFYISLRRSKIASLPCLPNTNVEEIQEKILVAHAVNLLNKLKFELENSQLNTDSFKLESFVGLNNFLVYFCTKYKKSVTDFIDQQTLDLVSLKFEYTCQSCNGEMKGFSCPENSAHLNMFCSVTFTPIESGDYLVCEACGVTARSELYDEMPLCVFCDKRFVRFEMII
ncbi:uncharacterized protein LOC121727950 [Aricia agestis]|uniref:uncharacterized protein LOC121727950 n=1 Tax=Aricia agestis TaxID=91739 RepID=UPI001C20713A|nr:uncharacterized protein LOC121727950 [Aricia agestis]